MKKLITYFPRISEDWATIVAWFIAAFIFLVLIWLQQRKDKQEQKQGVQKATSALINPVAGSSKFDAALFFRRAYVSPLQQETEDNIRTSAQQNQPNNREEFYVRLIAVGLIAYAYDLAWAYIYRSQLDLLLELNRGKVLP